MSVGAYSLQEPDLLMEDGSGVDSVHTDVAFLLALKEAAEEERRGKGRTAGNKAAEEERVAAFKAARLVLEEIGADNLKAAALNQAIDAEDAQGRLIGVLAFAVLEGERFREETLKALGLSGRAKRRGTLKRHEETFTNGYARVLLDIFKGVDVTDRTPDYYGVPDTTLEALLDAWGKGDAADFDGADTRMDKDDLRREYINYGYSRKNRGGGWFDAEVLKQQYKAFKQGGRIEGGAGAIGFEALLIQGRLWAFEEFAREEWLKGLLERRGCKLGE